MRTDVNVEARLATAMGALRAIEGPCDSLPWIAPYRDAGGGYGGLQAIARKALETLEREAVV